MIREHNAASLIGAKVVDSDGNKVGSVGQIFVDPQTGHPNWATVKTGFFGSSESFVPLEQANEIDGELRVPFSKDFVKDSPRAGGDGELSQDEEDALYEYYHGSLGGDTDGDRSDRVETDAVAMTAPGPGGETTGSGRDTAESASDDGMIRSEEQLRVGTERVATDRARLRKYVVTEEKSVTVPVSHEEVRVEHESVGDVNTADALHDGPGITDDEHGVVLTEERPVITTETVPVERVRIGTETVTEDKQVTGDVRKERIELDDGTPRTERG
jgi:uncharacterized protein (TIGR02271 family)